MCLYKPSTMRHSAGDCDLPCHNKQDQGMHLSALHFYRGCPPGQSPTCLQPIMLRRLYPNFNNGTGLRFSGHRLDQAPEMLLPSIVFFIYGNCNSAGMRGDLDLKAPANSENLLSLTKSNDACFWSCMSWEDPQTWFM